MIEDLKLRCDLLLVSLVGEKLVEKWWQSYNKFFEDTPANVFLSDPNRVYDYIIPHVDGYW